MILSGGRLITLEQAKRIRTEVQGTGKRKRKKHRNGYHQNQKAHRREPFKPCIIKPTSKPFCVFGANEESPLPAVSMGGDVAIYVLIDPRDNTVRYVGKSIDPKTRLAYHVADSKGWKKTWIENMRAEGHSPRMEIVDRATWDEWESAEQWWIQFYARRGSLYNIEVGGRGYLHRWKLNRAKKRKRKGHAWKM